MCVPLLSEYRIMLSTIGVLVGLGDWGLLAFLLFLLFFQKLVMEPLLLAILLVDTARTQQQVTPTGGPLPLNPMPQ